jgi:hypothetical protein
MQRLSTLYRPAKCNHQQARGRWKGRNDMNDERFQKVRYALQEAAIVAEQHITYGQPDRPSYKLARLVLDAWKCWPTQDAPQ